MQKLVFVNGNEESINLTAGNFGITNWAGLSNADLNLQTQQVPFQDGSVFIDALLNNREISVTLAINDDNDLYKRYQLKREVISALNPKFGEGYLYYTNDFYSRRIKCVPQLPIFENKNSNDSGTLKASVTWTACEVYWEDVEETEIFINSNESKIIDTDTDVETPIKAWFTDGAENASLNINGRSVSIESMGKPCMLDTTVGKKKFTSYELSLLMDSAPAFYVGFLDGYYYFAGGATVFGQSDVSSYLFKTKDFKECEIVDLNLSTDLTTARITCMDVNEAIDFGIIVTSATKIFCFKNGEWNEITYNLSGASSCAVLPSEYPDVLIVGNYGNLYHNTDTECTQWESVNSEHHYYSVKAREFTIGGVDYIALASDGSYVYGIDTSFNAVQLFSASNSYINYDYINGYFYDFINDRRSDDLSEWEDLSIIISDLTIGHLESLVYNGSMWVGITHTGFIVNSLDGINFTEFKKLNPSRQTYTGYFVYDDKHGNDILIMGYNIGIESYYKGSLLTIKPSFSYRCFNKNGTLEVIRNKAYIDGEIITLPVTPSSVSCNDDVFVIMDSASYVYSSTDGKTWVLKGRVFPSGLYSKKICFIKSLEIWVAIAASSSASSGILFQSQDLITWDIINAGSTLVDVAECDGLMVAITKEGRFVTYDGNEVETYYIASEENSVTGLCIAEKIGKILALANGTIYEQNIKNMRFLIGISFWAKIVTGFNFSSFTFMENYGLYFCKNSITNQILYSADLKTWAELLKNPQNANIVYDGEDMFLNTSDTVGKLSIVHEENTIDKIQGDMNLSFAKNNFIIYKNEKPSVLRLVYRNKYIGV